MTGMSECRATKRKLNKYCEEARHGALCMKHQPYAVKKSPRNRALHARLKCPPQSTPLEELLPDDGSYPEAMTTNVPAPRDRINLSPATSAESSTPLNKMHDNTFRNYKCASCVIHGCTGEVFDRVKTDLSFKQDLLDAEMHKRFLDSFSVSTGPTTPITMQIFDSDRIRCLSSISKILDKAKRESTGDASGKSIVGFDVCLEKVFKQFAESTETFVNSEALTLYHEEDDNSHDSASYRTIDSATVDSKYLSYRGIRDKKYAHEQIPKCPKLKRPRKNAWTREEEKLLLHARMKPDLNWQDIADMIPGRTLVAIRTKYRKLTHNLTFKNISQARLNSDYN